MTENVMNPDIGDLGSAASVVAPVMDQSNMMQAAYEVEQKQQSAAAFNQFADGIFALAPVVNEIAANRYIEKNLYGTDPQGDVQQAGFVTEKVSQDKYTAVKGEMDVQRRFYIEGIQTLSGLEEARKQGLIGHSEMMVRAQDIRAKVIDKAPLWADKIDASFRGTVGTSTGTGSITASPWQMTPEEEAMNEERKLNAAYASKFNVNLQTADRMRAEDAWVQRNKDMAVKNEADFTAWGHVQITDLRSGIQKAVLTQANENGTFSAEDIPKLKQDVMMWEQMAKERIQKKLVDMRTEGIVVDGETVNKMYSELDQEVERMNAYISDQDSVKYINNLVSQSEGQAKQYLWNSLPNVMILKEAGMDATKMTETLMTQGPRYQQFLMQNPTAAAAYEMLNDSDLGAKIAGTFNGVIATPVDEVGLPDDTTSNEFQSALAVMGPADMRTTFDTAMELGTIDKVLHTFRVDPSAVVNISGATAYQKWALPTDTVNQIFEHTGEGINARIMESKAVGTDPDVRLEFDTAGNPIVTGEGANSVVKGMITDTYNTILSNESVWKAYADSPEEYLRMVLPNTVKVPLSDEMAQDINKLRDVRDPLNVLKVVGNNMNSYLGSEESVDEVSRILQDNIRIARAGQQADLVRQLKSLDDQLWDTYLGEMDNEEN